jgi:hypothetical protein
MPTSRATLPQASVCCLRIAESSSGVQRGVVRVQLTGLRLLKHPDNLLLRETVKKGQPCGQVVFPDNPARDPVLCHFQRDALLVCKRHPGGVIRGDCVAHLATDR